MGLRPGHAAGEGEESSRDESGAGRLSSLPIYDGRIVKLSLDNVRLPDGSTSELELVKHPGAAAVLPFLEDPTDEDPEIVLIRQYRYAAGGFIYEVPAGMPSTPDESWEECAARELEEETGFRAHDLRYLSRILTTPGFTDECIHLFAATDLRPTRRRPDADEFLEVLKLRLSEALDAVRRGEIVDAKSVSSILFSATFRGKAWGADRAPPSR